jgi:hypothetical protein
MSLSFLSLSPYILLLIKSSHHDQIEKLIVSISIRKRTTTFFSVPLLVYLYLYSIIGNTCACACIIIFNCRIVTFPLLIVCVFFLKKRKKKLLFFLNFSTSSIRRACIVRVVHAGLDNLFIIFYLCQKIAHQSTQNTAISTDKSR